MKNIRKKGATYYADFVNVNGTRIRKSLGKDKVQARIKLLQLMADVEIQAITPNEEIPKSNKGKSFELAVNEFIKDEYQIQDAWTKKKFDQYGERQAQFVTNTIRDFSVSAKIKNVNQAKYSHMKSFLGYRALEVKTTSVNRYMQIFKRFFQYCEDMDFIEKNYARKLKKLKEAETIKYAFTDDEVKQIMDNAGCFKDYYIVGFATGRRPAEMVKLTQDDFEDVDGTKYFKLWVTKTKEFLHCPVSEDAATIINNAGHRIFPNASDDKWLDALRSNLRGNFSSSYVRKWNIRLYTIRHTFAMRCARAGIPKEVVQQMLGHSKITTTEIYYRQLPKENLTMAMKLLPSLPGV